MLAVLALALALAGDNECGVPAITTEATNAEAQQILADAERQFAAKLQELGLSGAAPLVGAESGSPARAGDASASQTKPANDAKAVEAQHAPKEGVNR